MAYVGQEPNANFSTNVSKDSFDGDGSTTAFTLTEGASTNTVDVFVENVRQEPTEAYSVDGKTLTFTAAPPTGTGNIYVVNKSPVRLQAAHPSGLALEAHSATISTTISAGGNVDIQGNELILDSDGDTSITADTDDVIDFRTAGSDRWQILANGNLKAVTNGLGIDFSASEGSGASSSVLDDYEEGTFTPNYTASTTNPTCTYENQDGRYVKIGRQVICNIVLRTDSVSGGSGYIKVSGLPFASNSYGANRAGTVHIGYSTEWTTAYPQSGYVNDSQTELILQTAASSDARSGRSAVLDISNMKTGANDNFIMATVIYTA
jgi:hypothetical protein